jgi:hypothetical protein
MGAYPLARLNSAATSMAMEKEASGGCIGVDCCTSSISTADGNWAVSEHGVAIFLVLFLAGNRRDTAGDGLGNRRGDGFGG